MGEKLFIKLKAWIIYIKKRKELIINAKESSGERKEDGEKSIEKSGGKRNLVLLVQHVEPRAKERKKKPKKKKKFVVKYKKNYTNYNMKEKKLATSCDKKKQRYLWEKLWLHVTHV